jgi:hypothetical protein
MQNLARTPIVGIKMAGQWEWLGTRSLRMDQQVMGLISTYTTLLAGMGELGSLENAWAVSNPEEVARFPRTASVHF